MSTKFLLPPHSSVSIRVIFTGGTSTVNIVHLGKDNTPVEGWFAVSENGPVYDPLVITNDSDDKHSVRIDGNLAAGGRLSGVPLLATAGPAAQDVQVIAVMAVDSTFAVCVIENVLAAAPARWQRLPPDRS